MSGQFPRILWTRQPQGVPPGPNRANPFGARLVGAITPFGSVTGKPLTYVGTPARAPRGNAGTALVGNNATLISEAFSTTGLAYPFTMVAVMGNITRTANADIAGGLGNTAGDQLCVFQFVTSTNNRFVYRNVNGGAALIREFSANATSSNTGPVVLSVTVNSASSADVYWNGVLDNGTTIANTSNAPAMNRLALGGVDRATDSFADTGTDASGIFVFQGGFSAAEHAFYSRNPWQALAPIDRAIWVDVPASGGTTVAPSKGALTFTGYVPTVTRTDNQTVAPAKGALTFTGKVPTVTRTDNQTVAPAKGALTFTGYVPTVTQDSGTVIAPSKGALTFTGKVPTITQTANQIIVPSKGALTFTGKIPTVTQTGAVTYARAPRGSGYPGTPPTTTRPGQTNTARPKMATTRR